MSGMCVINQCNFGVMLLSGKFTGNQWPKLKALAWRAATSCLHSGLAGLYNSLNRRSLWNRVLNFCDSASPPIVHGGKCKPMSQSSPSTDVSSAMIYRGASRETNASIVAAWSIFCKSGPLNSPLWNTWRSSCRSSNMPLTCIINGPSSSAVVLFVSSICLINASTSASESDCTAPNRVASAFSESYCCWGRCQNILTARSKSPHLGGRRHAKTRGRMSEFPN